MRSYLLLLTLISLGCETSPATGAVEGEVCATAAECASELRCVANLCVPASALICPEEVVEFAPKTLHRLNRIEYDNAVRDLLGVEVAPARDFPADDHGHGFDNIADVLTIAPLLVEKWEAAATWVVDEALRALPDEATSTRFEAEDVGSDVGILRKETTWKLTEVGGIVVDLQLTGPGEHRLTVRGFQLPAGQAPARLELTADGVEIGAFDVAATEDAPGTFDARWQAGPGAATVSARFTNPFHDPQERDGSRQTRALVIDWLEVDGPLDLEAQASSSSRGRLLACDSEGDPQACAGEALGRFAAQAWRRPLEDGEVDGVLGVRQVAIDLGADEDEAMRWAMQSILLSPWFLFRVEEAVAQDAGSRPLSGTELASRLAFFLWSSTPDEPLLRAAEEGPDAVLAEQERMLLDDRTRSFVENFAGQWLFVRAVDRIDPEYGLFPQFDEELRAAMRSETESFFHAFLREDRPAVDMFDADFTFVNARLARHYGLPEPEGSGFARVDVGGTVREGLLTQAGPLSVTSRRTRTSLVKRGWWVLKQLLCNDPPPAPAPANLGDDEEGGGGLRERLERHRQDPACAVCHTAMDPIGFALEVFDPIGGWRNTDGQGPIDARGEMPDGTPINGPLELAAQLKRDPRAADCIQRQMFTYAMGRGPTSADDCAMRGIRDDWRSGGGSLGGLVRAITSSAPFTRRIDKVAP